MFHGICNLYRTVKKTEKYYDELLVLTGRKDAIDERSLGPKVVRDTVDNLPDDTADASTTTIVTSPHDASATVPKKKYRLDISEEQISQSLNKLTVISKDLDEIQPRADQVWNVDEIRIDPNGKWYRIVCTYKWCNIARVWKTQQGKHAPFWATLCFFTRADG